MGRIQDYISEIKEKLEDLVRELSQLIRPKRPSVVPIPVKNPSFPPRKRKR